VSWSAPKTEAPEIVRCDRDADEMCATCADVIQSKSPLVFEQETADVRLLFLLFVRFLCGLSFSVFLVITDQTLHRAERNCGAFLTTSD